MRPNFRTRMENKKRKRRYTEVSINFNFPIFFQPWWLDVVCQYDDWDFSMSKNSNGEIVGIMPYYLRKIWGKSLIRMPPLTPYLGVWLNYSNIPERNIKKYSFEFRTINHLINQLPKFIWYHQIHPEQLENWLPFYNHGFKQSTRYTYVFENTNPDHVYKSMKDKTRNMIKKAKKLLAIETASDTDSFFRISASTFIRQNRSIPFDKEMFSQLHQEILSRKCGCIFYAKDGNGYIGGTLYLIWDSTTAYLWQLGAEKGFRNSGAVQLLIWEAIKKTNELGLRFNFEGSMLPNVEPVFRAFGAERKPVFQIYKTSNRFLDAIRAFIKG